jgi:hypothetical protein
MCASRSSRAKVSTLNKDAYFSLGIDIRGVILFNMGVKTLEVPAETAKRLLIEAELERILTSPGFRTSKRSQEFLRYIVMTALEGRVDDLKERVIGFQVFERCPDYDTGEYSIVRVKANELRKRLAQFYSESTDSSSVQIHLPRGSYTPEFRWPEAAASEVPIADLPKTVPPVRVKLRLLVSGLSLALLMFASWHFYPGHRMNQAEELFWQPIVNDPIQPLICVADPEVLKFDGRYDALAFNGALPAYVPTSALLKDSDHYVGWGDALALTQISTFLALHHREPSIQTGNDVSFAELSRAPVILIGARSNPWTMQLANDLRFVFERTETGSYIRDKKDPNKKWAFELGPPEVDHIVITRVFESKTGRMLVLAAGLSHIGTQVAGQILTNSTYLSKALHDAPHDWYKRNLQLVFRVEVYGNSAGTPTLEASNYW